MGDHHRATYAARFNTRGIRRPKRKAFPEQGMTFIQFAQHVIPGLSDTDADWVLYERTPFPLVQGRDDLMPYLVAERERRAT